MDPLKFGRYEIRGEIGRGGMATVYHAHDPRFEREVAIKVLPREMLFNPQLRIRFEREAKTIAMLENPAIVPVHDFGEEDGQPYFVMRYMTGGSLTDRMKEGPIPIQTAANLLAHIAPALDDAHAKGIVHRDLKPSNILFDQFNQPYISDFGIAKLTELHTDVTGSAIIGTPAYMSPEQAHGEGVDGRSDIYALGVMLFEMLTGQQPYHGDTPMSVVVRHITDPVPRILEFKPDLPPDVNLIIEKAMAKDRRLRYHSVKSLSEDLDKVARGERLVPETPAVAADSSAPTVLGSANMAPSATVVAPPTPVPTPAPASVPSVQPVAPMWPRAPSFTPAPVPIPEVAPSATPATPAPIPDSKVAPSANVAPSAKVAPSAMPAIQAEAQPSVTPAPVPVPIANVAPSAMPDIQAEAQPSVTPAPTPIVEVAPAAKVAPSAMPVIRPATPVPASTGSVLSSASSSSSIPWGQVPTLADQAEGKSKLNRRTMLWLGLGAVILILFVLVTGLSILARNRRSALAAIQATQTMVAVQIAQQGSNPLPIVDVAPSATLAATPVPSVTLVPNATLAPSATPVPSQTPVSTLVPSSTAAPSSTRQAAFKINANIRSGPGTLYPILTVYTAGTKIDLLGRNHAGDWLAFSLPGGKTGWASLNALQVDFDVSTLPELSAPPPPTQPPLPTATPSSGGGAQKTVAPP